MSLLDDAIPLFFKPLRAIGFLIPHVVLEEVHQDELAITNHPVERGAAITDHAFKVPAVVRIACGWSDSSAGLTGYSRDIYEALQALQTTRQPFNVSTGKRFYRNMLFRSLEVVTDAHSENTLMVQAVLQEVLLVSTETTAAPASSQAMPEKTAASVDRGTVQPVPYPARAPYDPKNSLAPAFDAQRSSVYNPVRGPTGAAGG